jgi:hypothetical protein
MPFKDMQHLACFSTTPLVINHVTNQVDLTKKANPWLRNEERNQKLESTQLNKSDNCRCMIKITKLGFPN